MRNTLFVLLCLLSPWALADMPKIPITAGFHRIEAEVAANDSDRQRGLMERRTMETNQGMLFVFANQAHHCMWMRNTLLPLSVAFIDTEGRIINIEDMRPQTDQSHCATTPAAFALEMNQGWFARRGISPGLRLGGLDKAPAPR